MPKRPTRSAEPTETGNDFDVTPTADVAENLLANLVALAKQPKPVQAKAEPASDALPTGLGELIAMLKRLEAEPEAKTRADERARRARLETVRRAVFAAQQTPTAPVPDGNHAAQSNRAMPAPREVMLARISALS
jgi:hypothetical protein